MSKRATPPPESSRLRSDAAANRERILEAASIAVGRDGEKVPMATIALQAGVGIGTLYRHYPTRQALLTAISTRSFELVLTHARAAALSHQSAISALAQFFEQTIAARDDLILPLHGGPAIHDTTIAALRTDIRTQIGHILARGRREGTIRPDITPADIIITGAMLAQPLPTAENWDKLARRQAKIYIAGLATDEPTPRL
jgi:AcrR family transcriptional regulator